MKQLPIILLLFLGATISLLASNWILNHYFADNGEAFYKGPGHLLKENMTFGIITLVCRYFLFPLFGFLLITKIWTKTFNNRLRVIVYSWTFIISLLSIWIFSKTYYIASNHWDGFERILEISLFCYLPWLAALIVYSFRMRKIAFTVLRNQQ